MCYKRAALWCIWLRLTVSIFVDMEVKLWFYREGNCREKVSTVQKVSTNRAWDSWEGARYPAHGWSLTTRTSPKSPGLTTSPAINMWMKDVYQGLIYIFPSSPFTLRVDNNSIQKHWQENIFALISDSHILAYSHQYSKTCKYTKLPILSIKFVIGKWNYTSQDRPLSLFL